jgi:hypothetical protein
MNLNFLLFSAASNSIDCSINSASFIVKSSNVESHPATMLVFVVVSSHDPVFPFTLAVVEVTGMENPSTPSRSPPAASAIPSVDFRITFHSFVPRR